MSSETPYAETEALLSVMNGEQGEAQRNLSEFTDTELVMFEDNLSNLRDLIRDEWRTRGIEP
jgi:hypothetical protein